MHPKKIEHDKRPRSPEQISEGRVVNPQRVTYLRERWSNSKSCSVSKREVKYVRDRRQARSRHTTSQLLVVVAAGDFEEIEGHMSISDGSGSPPVALSGHLSIPTCVRIDAHNRTRRSRRTTRLHTRHLPLHTHAFLEKLFAWVCLHAVDPVLRHGEALDT
jgi:hypothetical protein